MVRSCQHILMKIMKQRHGHVFNKTVGVERLNLYKYFDIIKHPMDHETVKSRLDKKEHRTSQDFPTMPWLTSFFCSRTPNSRNRVMMSGWGHVNNKKMIWSKNALMLVDEDMMEFGRKKKSKRRSIIILRLISSVECFQFLKSLLHIN